MERRKFLATAVASTVAAGTIPGAAALAEKGYTPPFKGIGVLRHPLGEYEVDGKIISCQELAHELCKRLHDGAVIALPCTKDEDGQYLWEFRIEAADPKQIQVKRSGE